MFVEILIIAGIIAGIILGIIFIGLSVFTTYLIIQHEDWIILIIWCTAWFFVILAILALLEHSGVI